MNPGLSELVHVLHLTVIFKIYLDPGLHQRERERETERERERERQRERERERPVANCYGCTVVQVDKCRCILLNMQ